MSFYVIKYTCTDKLGPKSKIGSQFGDTCYLECFYMCWFQICIKRLKMASVLLKCWFLATTQLYGTFLQSKTNYS